MNEKVYVVLTIKNTEVFDWYNDCGTDDTERHILEIIGVYSTYDKARMAAIRARARRPERKPWWDEGYDEYNVCILMRSLDCDQGPHEIVYYIASDDVEDEDDE